MNPIHFDEANKVLTAPNGMDNCGSLSTYSDGETCLSCWRPSWRERLSIAVFGRIWLWVHSGQTQPPVSLLGARTVFESAKGRGLPASLSLVVLLLAALSCIGCDTLFHGGGLPKPVQCALCQVVTDPTLKAACEKAACPAATATVTAAPTAVSTPTPTIPPTPTSTSGPAVTASPTAPIPGWVTRLDHVQGFSGCNPYPCDPTTAACAVILDEHGNRRYPLRQRCSGDRTFYFQAPGLDRLTREANCQISAPRNTGIPDYLAKCLRFDSPGTPCGGSPACDGDHLSCERTRIACNGAGHDDPRGSILKASGIDCTNGDGFSFSCTGTPGTHYMLCARPYGDAREANGTPILVVGTGESCASGWF